MTAMGIIIFKITKLKTLRFKEFKKAVSFPSIFTGVLKLV